MCVITTDLDTWLGKGNLPRKHGTRCESFSKIPLAPTMSQDSRLNVGDSVMTKIDMVPDQRSLKSREEVRHCQLQKTVYLVHLCWGQVVTK